MTDDKFTKIASGLLVQVRDLVEWGIDTGNTTAEELKLTIPARREKVRQLSDAGMSQRQIAEVVGVSPATVNDDMFKNRTENVQNLNAREEKEAAIRAANAELKQIDVDPIKVRYGTIVIDPPWDMEKIKRDVRPNQVAFDYPTMTEEELERFPVADMAADDCHLFCWTTMKFLPVALRLISAWRFKYYGLMVWYKPGGFQPHGFYQNNCEFVIYARNGSPKFRDTQAFMACFQGERREHSRKPDVFYDTIRRVTSDGRIDVFSREQRDGFDKYGNESEKFNKAS